MTQVQVNKLTDEPKRDLLRVKSIVLFLFCSLITTNVFANSLDQAQGTYLERSPYCTIGGAPDENEVWKKCEPQVLDCLSIEPLTETTAWVSALTIQTNGHTCGFSAGAVETSPGVLTAIDEDENKLEVHYLRDPIRVLGTGLLCG